MGNEGSDSFDHQKKRLEHMAQRRSHGLKFRELAEEFETSKSTAHRKIQQREHKEND